MFNMKNKITYKDLADKLNDLYYVYLDEDPPHLISLGQSASSLESL